MIPTYQTSFGKPPGGNCVAACLASIFEVSIDDVDSLELRGGGPRDQFSAIVDVCWRFGYQPFSYSPGGPFFPAIAPRGLSLACSGTHATVAFDGRILFDPHPRSTGLAEITEWIMLIPIALEGATRG